jgi:hypothetical protein
MAYSSWQTDLKNTEYTALTSFGEQRYWPPATILGALIYRIRLALPLREHHPRPKHPRHPSSACTPVTSFRRWALARVGGAVGGHGTNRKSRDNTPSRKKTQSTVWTCPLGFGSIQRRLDRSPIPHSRLDMESTPTIGRFPPSANACR